MSLTNEDRSAPEERRTKREVAYTPIGRNALFVALVTHAAALFLAMTGLPGVVSWFYSLYLSGWALLIVGLHAELRDRGYRPVRDYRFYLLAFLAIFPIVGPLVALIALSLMTGIGKETPFSFFGMIASFLRLRANSIVILLSVLLLFALFAFIYSSRDPYFKRAREKRGPSMRWSVPVFISLGDSTNSTRKG
jgi:hypothetical protein